MTIINRPRGTGKTTQLIYLSEINRIPIVSRNPDYIIDMAKKMGCNIPSPIAITKYIGLTYGRNFNDRPQKFYIDDLECVLDCLFPNVDVITTSIGKEGFKGDDENGQG